MPVHIDPAPSPSDPPAERGQKQELARKRRRDRKPPISYRPPKGREAEFLARVAESGLSINAFINAQVFRRDRRIAIPRAELAMLLEHAARIRENLERIDKDGLYAGSAGLIAASIADVDFFRTVLLKATKRCSPKPRRRRS